MSEAFEAVRQALYSYCRGVDRLDRDAIAAAFWPDAVITLGTIYTGPPPGFVDTAIAFMEMFTSVRHEVGNFAMVGDDDAIGYEAYVRTWHWIAPRAVELTVLGRYIGRARCRDGVWRIAEHSELMDWGEERPVDAGWFIGNGELEKGRRDRRDGSYRYLIGDGEGASGGQG